MPFEQLRSLVVSLIDECRTDTVQGARAERAEPIVDDAEAEFDAQPTTFRPARRLPPPPPPRPSVKRTPTRASTLDDLIESLRDDRTQRR